MDHFEQPDRPLPGAPWDHHEDYWRRVWTCLEKVSFVYLIQAGNGPIKVGLARKPLSRLRGLQTSHYEELKILRVLPGDRNFEAHCHSRIKHAHIRGEWFRKNEITEFLEWFESEGERMIDVYEETGELPRFDPGPRRNKSRGMSSRFNSAGGLRQGLRTKPEFDAPVTVRFVDPATLRKDAA